MEQALTKDSVIGDQVIRVEVAHFCLHLITPLHITIIIMVIIIMAIIIMEATITVVAIIPIEDNSNSKEKNN